MQSSATLAYMTLTKTTIINGAKTVALILSTSVCCCRMVQVGQFLTYVGDFKALLDLKLKVVWAAFLYKVKPLIV